MILTCKELYEKTENPRINMISLELLREYYDTYLNPFSYRFDIKDDSQSEPRTIELRFDHENFCHLLGIESIVRRSVRNKSEYKGIRGWERVKSGEINFNDLKIKNKLGFKDNKARFVFFYLIPKLIDTPKGVLFNPQKMTGNTRVECELLFFDQFQKAYVHVGIEYNEKSKYYIPRTFLIEKITNDNDGLKYVGNQQEITLVKIEKNKMFNPSLSR